ncbi:MAG TPA: hypothetical protein VGM25_05405 [Caulobacteraceae bacterium]|jgi:hypothetical protein
MALLRASGRCCSGRKPPETAMADFLYIAGGVAVLLLFAGYALVLRRA